MSVQAGDRTIVIGTGELGTRVVEAMSRRLGDDGPPGSLAVLLRPPRPGSVPPSDARRACMAMRNIAVEEADVAADTIERLAGIMRDYDTVICCVGFAAGAGTQLKIARAALAAGVKRYVPWQFGVDYDVIGRGSPQDLFDEQLDVRDLLRGQRATEWIIVSSGMFTSFLFEPAFGVVDLDTTTVASLGDWDTEVTVTTAEDIGILTAEIVYATPRIADEVVYLAGDTISYGQLAAVVERVTGAAVTRVHRSVDQLVDELRRDPDDTMRKYRAVFAQGKGVSWQKSSSFNATHHIPTTTVEDWLRTEIG